MAGRSTTWCWPQSLEGRAICCWPAANPSGTWCCASVPVSLHQEQSGRSLGNQVGWMAVPLLVGEPCHARRLALIAALDRSTS